jgi:RNA polymerase sigma factor (sigma-70 family)
MEPVEELIPTRASLLRRLKDWQDEASWQVFFDTYWQLIYGVALKRGMTKTEAEEVVQLTLISVAKHMPGFKYDPALGSFKAWLLNMTRWRISDQLRKRQAQGQPLQVLDETIEPGPGEGASSAESCGVPPELEKLWEEEWQTNLLGAALAKARRRVDPQQYQLFDCYVNKEWPAERVAQTFAVSLNQVYLAKHRVTELIKEEVERIQKDVV